MAPLATWALATPMCSLAAETAMTLQNTIQSLVVGSYVLQRGFCLSPIGDVQARLHVEQGYIE